jgi:hypothetical protein
MAASTSEKSNLPSCGSTCSQVVTASSVLNFAAAIRGQIGSM